MTWRDGRRVSKSLAQREGFRSGAPQTTSGLANLGNRGAVAAGPRSASLPQASLGHAQALAFWRWRRRNEMPANPASPVPTSSSVPGSGTGEDPDPPPEPPPFCEPPFVPLLPPACPAPLPPLFDPAPPFSEPAEDPVSVATLPRLPPAPLLVPLLEPLVELLRPGSTIRVSGWLIGACGPSSVTMAREEWSAQAARPKHSNTVGISFWRMG